MKKSRVGVWSCMAFFVAIVAGVLISAMDASAMELPDRERGAAIFDRADWIIEPGERIISSITIAHESSPTIVAHLHRRAPDGNSTDRLVGIDADKAEMHWVLDDAALIERLGGASLAGPQALEMDLQHGVLVVSVNGGRYPPILLDPLTGNAVAPPELPEGWRVARILGRSLTDKRWWVIAERWSAAEADGAPPKSSPSATSNRSAAGDAPKRPWRVYQLGGRASPLDYPNLVIPPAHRLPCGGFLTFSPHTREYLNLDPETGQPRWRRAFRQEAHRLVIDAQRIAVYSHAMSRMPFFWDPATGRDLLEVPGFRADWHWLGDWSGHHLVARPDGRTDHRAEWLDAVVSPQHQERIRRDSRGDEAVIHAHARGPAGPSWQLLLDEQLIPIRGLTTGRVLGVVSRGSGFGILLDEHGPAQRLFMDRYLIDTAEELWLAGAVDQSPPFAGDGHFLAWNGVMPIRGTVMELDAAPAGGLAISGHWTARRMMAEGGLRSVVEWVVKRDDVAEGSRTAPLSGPNSARSNMLRAIQSYAAGQRRDDVLQSLRAALMSLDAMPVMAEWCELFDWLAEEPANHRYIGAAPFSRLFHENPVWRRTAAQRLVRLIRMDTPLTFPAEARRRWWDAIASESDPDIAALLAEGWLNTFDVTRQDRAHLARMLRAWAAEPMVAGLLLRPLLEGSLDDSDLELLLPLMQRAGDLRAKLMTRFQADPIGQQATWRLLISDRAGERALGLSLIREYRATWEPSQRQRIALRLAELMEVGQGPERVQVFEVWPRIEIIDQVAADSLRRRLNDPLFSRRKIEVLRALERQGTVGAAAFEDLLEMLRKPPAGESEMAIQVQVIATVAAMGRNPLVRNRIAQLLRSFAYPQEPVDVRLQAAALRGLTVAGIGDSDLPRLREQMRKAPLIAALEAFTVLWHGKVSLEQDILGYFDADDPVSSWRGLQFLERKLVLRHESLGRPTHKVAMQSFPGLAMKLAELVERCDERVADVAMRFLIAMGEDAAPAVPIYSRMLTGADRARAMHGLGLLERTGDAAQLAGPTVLAMITGRDDQHRGFGLEVMRRLGPRMAELVPTVAETMRVNRRLIPNIEPWVRAMSAASPGHESVTDALLEILEVGNENQQMVAARELGSLRRLPPSSAPTLERLLNSNNMQVRMVAVSSLGRLGRDAESALASLKQLQESDNLNLSLRAQHSVMLIERAIEPE
ncbi:MAG: HEAT repeat domain-containing protein [Phycisphaeraceae bacterium]|nr:HEAT repeat domain-containing protein [Phycisphaeraceae bacterium]